MNNKAQFFIGGLIDASTLPKWLLYPLIFIIMILIFVVSVVMIFFVIALFRGEATFMPFWGGYMPFGGIGIGVSSISTQTTSCMINGIAVPCSDFPSSYKTEGFRRNDTTYSVNGVCPSPNSNMSLEECIQEVIRQNE